MENIAQIPIAPSSEQLGLVGDALVADRKGQNSMVIERDIDQRVSRLHGLTLEEIRIVKGGAEG